MAKSLHELKVDKLRTKNKNIITDMDYVLRDKEDEKARGNPNTVYMNVVDDTKAKPRAKA